ncbi:MAG TPA: hypothetical protein DCM87_12265, partial [Planctomycetes bacterium]|nr:hypothetical protein [Planctomycetota bacterium]
KKAEPEKKTEPEPEKKPEPPRPLLGIDVEGDGQTLKVVKVTPGGPADGKLLAGDVIAAFADKPVRTIAELKAVVDGLVPGKEVAVKVFREGKEVQVAIVPAAK